MCVTYKLLNKSKFIYLPGDVGRRTTGAVCMNTFVALDAEDTFSAFSKVTRFV